ncbi:MAG: chitobiase/beta-hexosaminidase C-terminal domain-containing protein, partial [Prevotellaceae bacterium]|nr:chitobiase/beta-hexosaminidase C-terminal domain-containing protein [Prevotellaceae bacterium]
AIFYTLDNTPPSATNGLAYSQPIVITESVVIRAIAVKEGLVNSEIAVFQYTVQTGTGIDLAENRTITVYAYNGKLFIKGLEAKEQYTIYSVLGNVIAQGTAVNANVQEITLPYKGVFIVSTLNTKTKVLVK